MPEKNILYVEDDFDNHTLVKLFLKNEPWNLIIAETPGQAHEALASQPMDLVIVDLNLQEEGDGATLIRELKKNPEYESIPVFVFSGFDENHFSKYGLDDSIQRFFRKPTSKKMLIEAIRSIGDTK
ncbi:response regulator [Balneolales bacterium ANBcel1]|nr:response regulator [Balneolales bacterium ANBcel1]